MQSFAAALRPGFTAARANLGPGLVLQAVSIAIILGYYFYPPFHRALDAVAGVKARLGLLYSVPSTVLFGALIPFAVMRLNRRTTADTPWSDLFFNTGFWAYKGLEVDTLYRLQSFLFGDTPDLRTLLAKVAVDQGLYNPFLAVPVILVAFKWKEVGFSLSALGRCIREGFIGREFHSMVMSTWVVWIPAVTLIYFLPLALQIPMFNLVLCFWTLMLARLTGKRNTAQDAVAVVAA